MDHHLSSDQLRALEEVEEERRREPPKAESFMQAYGKIIIYLLLFAVPIGFFAWNFMERSGRMVPTVDIEAQLAGAGRGQIESVMGRPRDYEMEHKGGNALVYDVSEGDLRVWDKYAEKQVSKVYLVMDDKEKVKSIDYDYSE